MFKFLYRFISHLLCLIVIELPLQLLGAIVLIPLISLKLRIGSLPIVFRWFDSADPFVGRDTSVIERINNGTYWAPSEPIWKTLLNRYTWMGFRNPTNYFNYKVLGFQFTGKEQYILTEGLDVGDSTNDVAGLKHIELSTGYYEYNYVKRIGDKACLYFRLGWKIGDMRNKPGSYCQKVLTISYRSYSGK